MGIEGPKSLLEGQGGFEYYASSFPRSFGGTVASESALRSARAFLLRVRAPQPAPWPDGGPESLRPPCCGLAIYKNQTSFSTQRRL
ncbi:hypothetical protein PoB_005680100 [Plakobranchus ocellatus]|uniref:Uncharacterized protein n=1 Tax=Plakobranchus ocellatus TaxID=259542 RepID=A0AAV4C4Q1_9GAST|nr:hypothetical protein PoB_005680100 [Plakobranchus ocellatus]